MSHAITLEPQAETHEVGEIIFRLGEILTCVECWEDGTYQVTTRPATPDEEAAFWAKFQEDVRSLTSARAR
jgi:hypothetical protein